MLTGGLLDPQSLQWCME